MQAALWVSYLEFTNITICLYLYFYHLCPGESVLLKLVWLLKWKTRKLQHCLRAARSGMQRLEWWESKQRERLVSYILGFKPDFFISGSRAGYFSSEFSGSKCITFSCLNISTEDMKKSDAIIISCYFRHLGNHLVKHSAFVNDSFILSFVYWGDTARDAAWILGQGTGVSDFYSFYLCHN